MLKDRCLSCVPVTSTHSPKRPYLGCFFATGLSEMNMTRCAKILVHNEWYFGSRQDFDDQADCVLTGVVLV